jgi:hypothetical protein
MEIYQSNLKKHTTAAKLWEIKWEAPPQIRKEFNYTLWLQTA